MEEIVKINFDDLRHDEDGYMFHEGNLFTGIAFDSKEDGKSEIEFVNGMEDGWSRGWYKNGQLQGETYYTKGRANGANREWYENGQMKLEEEIIDGEGVWERQWDEQGNLITEIGKPSE